MAYEFHYTPTGTGVISGKEVLEQTEDAINDLGNTAISGVQEALDKAEQALTNSENAVDDAQTALNTANNAEGVAIQAQTDVSNLSGTVTNIGNRVTTAEGNITNLQGRMTTAEGNITNLQGRMTTAEGNIGNLQTAVSTAQATANSAQQTATTARQQSYVFRYSSTALVASSTNSNTLLDNTDNLKVGDKVIDSSGVLFSITAIDTANSTFTIGTALIDLAQDSDVVHKSGNETIGGVKTFTDSMQLKSNVAEYGITGGSIQFSLIDKNNVGLSKIVQGVYNNGISYITLQLYGKDSNNQTVTNRLQYQYSSDFSYSYILPTDNSVWLGTTGNRWGKVYGIQYYYGSNNVEFSTKFVTTDTAQTISGAKTFSDDLTIYNNDSSQSTKNLIIGSSKIQVGDTSNSDSFGINFNAGLSYVASVLASKDTSGTQNLRFFVRTKDNSNNFITSRVRFKLFANGNSFFESETDNAVSLGSSSYKFKDVQTYKVNNLEPSSLSLPSGNVSDVIDISSYITALDGTSNSYTVPSNGWISIAITGTAIAIVSSSWSDSRLRASSGNVRMLYPVLKNETLGISVIGTTLDYARFIPCQGNV